MPCSQRPCQCCAAHLGGFKFPWLGLWSSRVASIAGGLSSHQGLGREMPGNNTTVRWIPAVLPGDVTIDAQNAILSKKGGSHAGQIHQRRHQNPRLQPFKPSAGSTRSQRSSWSCRTRAPLHDPERLARRRAKLLLRSSSRWAMSAGQRYWPAGLLAMIEAR